MLNWRYAYFQVHGRRPPRRSPRTWSAKKPARNPKYRAWIRTLPCAVCGLEGTGKIEAAHTGSDGGTSLKASDYSCIPLCFDHHQALSDSYHHGKETFERAHGIECAAVVRRLNHAWFAYSGMVK